MVDNVLEKILSMVRSLATNELQYLQRLIEKELVRRAVQKAIGQ